MEESYLLKTLLKSKANKEIIGIWQYGDSEGFLAGYVIDLNEEFFSFQHLTKYGKLDGIIIDRIETIQSVDFNDDYSKAMQYVFDNASRLDVEEIVNIELSEKENWQTEIINELVGNTHQLVSIEISGEEKFTGFIEKASKTDIVLHCVGKLGEDEECVIYKIDDITSFKLNDLDNRKRKLLYDWRKASL